MNECREAFEKWARDAAYCVVYRVPEGTEKPIVWYVEAATRVAWEAWQAAWNYKEKSDEA